MKALRTLLVPAGFVAMFGIGVAISTSRFLKADPPRKPVIFVTEVKAPATPDTPEAPTTPNDLPLALATPPTPPSELPPVEPVPATAPSELPPADPSLPTPVIVDPANEGPEAVETGPQRATPKASKPTKKKFRLAPVELPGSDTVELPAVAPSPDHDPSVDSGDSLTSVGDDPERSVKEFLTRNQQAANKELTALKKEAETLRERLRKVESAIRQWDAVAQALQRSQDGAREILGSPPTVLPSADAPASLDPLPSSNVQPRATSPAVAPSSPPVAPSPAETKPASSAPTPIAPAPKP